MKRIFLLLAVIILSADLTAQQTTSLNFSLLRKLSTARIADQPISLFVKGNPQAVRRFVEQSGGTYKYAAGDISAVQLSLSKVRDLAAVNGVTRIEDNDLKLQPMNDQLVVNNHVQEVHFGFNLPQGYTGENVVMGIIDEGIDFRHPDFRDEFGRTRIDYLWDQSIINFDPNTQAQPYGYGKEYTGSQIDTSTQHFDSRFSHGSHVTGIACGNGLSLNNYKGVAPKADMIIVKMDLNQPDNEFLSNLVDAVKYIYDRAEQMGKPAVINVSLGTYFGSHDGKDIQAQAIDFLITEKPGRALVASAGNAGTAPIHIGYEVSPDTNFTWMQHTSNGIYIQAWGDSGSFENIQFSISADRVRPDYSTVGNLPFRTVNHQPGVVINDTIWNGSNRIGIIQSMAQYWNGTWSQEYFILPDSIINIQPGDTSRYFWRIETTGTGRLDAWSFDLVFDNLPDMAAYPLISKYKIPDTEQTIVSSFTCSDKVITVGSYVNRNFYSNANFAVTRDTSLEVGALSGFSSRGPTRDGRIKPDITATGEWVLSCGAQSELNILAAVEPDKVAAGRKHKRSSGTSMASPVVAGIAALYLERYPSATWQDVKNAIINCADQDQFTGTALPDNNWGYGKVNGYSAIKGCTVGIDELNSYSNAFLGLAPNPLEATGTIQYDLTSVPRYQFASIRITDLTGREISTSTLQHTAGSIDMHSSQFTPGVYLVSLLIDGKNAKVTRLVVM